MPEALREAPRAAVAAPPRALRGVAIAGVAAAVPEGVVTNAPIAARLGVGEDWIVSRTGIRERRIAGPGECLRDLAAEAGRRALSRAGGLDAAALDLVLVGTMTADEITPNAAPLVAADLGAVRAGTLDVGGACTAFLGALALAAGQIECGRADSALVIGADLLSRVTDPLDRRTAALFGDGAGAAVLVATPAPGRVGPVVLRADGSGARCIFARRDEGVIRMDGQETFRHAVARLAEATLEAVALAGAALSDVDAFVYHQANGRILRAVGERLGLPPERVVDVIGCYGNTSAATIPIALAAAERDGLVGPGAKVLLAAFGAGFTYGGTVVEWGTG